MKLKNITPEAYRCGKINCHAIYTACGIGQCPTVIADSENPDSYVIVGKEVQYSAHPDIDERVGKDEVALEITAALVNEAVNAELTKRVAELEAVLTEIASETKIGEGMIRVHYGRDAQRVARAALSPKPPEIPVHDGEYSIPD